MERKIIIREDSTRLEYLTFPALDQTGIVKHLFTTRLGGVSKGIYSSMNLSFSRGDNADDVTENYRRIAQVLQCELEGQSYGRARELPHRSGGFGLSYRTVQGSQRRSSLQPGISYHRR